MGTFTKPAFAAALLLGIASGPWQRQAVETDADFRGFCAVNPEVAWVGGTKGTYRRTTDDGKTWKPLDGENYNSVGFAPTGAGWAVGPKGRIARFAK